MAGKDKDKEKEHQRDWDRELADVDKLLSKLPTYERTVPVPAPGTAPKWAGAPSSARLPADRAWFGTWLKVGLGLALAIGMTQWPYTNGCGFRLYFYLLGVASLLVAGVWASISSWQRRMGIAHLLSHGLIIWGLVLAAREILPRVGYAAASATWLCRPPPSTIAPN